MWLPLTGDLHNQGLSGLTATNNGATVNNNGKIGKCYQMDGSHYITIASKPWMSMKPAYNFSLFLWVKGTTTGWLIAAGGWELRLCPTFIKISLSGNGQYPANLNQSFDTNTWYHLGFTWNGGAGELKLYLNGSCVATSNVPSSANFSVNSSLKFTYDGPRYLNDIRIYDHCLSAKEVEEISKGLVLHYKLDDPASIEKTTNLCNGATCGTQASATSPATWGGHKYYTILEDTTVNDPIPFQKKSIMTIDFNTSYGSGGGASVYPPVSFNIEPSTTYIYSRYIKPSDNFAYTSPNFLYRYEYASGGGTRLIEGGVFNKTNIEYIGNGWYRCWGSFTSQNTAATVTLPFYTYPGKSITYELGGIQLEKNTHMTPYVISSNTPMIIDSSGYSNNGTIVGSLKTITPSPRYSCATHIPATSSKIRISNFLTSGFGNSYSFAWWGKRNSNSPMFWGFSDGIRLNGMYLGNLWNTGDSSNNPLYKVGTTTQVSAPSVNVWHHYVMTGNGTKCYIYLDGELWAEAKIYRAISGTSIYINGWDSGTSYCSDNTDMSDFRIYATALTAEQVADLYHTSMTIDNQGNIHARELVEL